MESGVIRENPRFGTIAESGATKKAITFCSDDVKSEMIQMLNFDDYSKSAIEKF